MQLKYGVIHNHYHYSGHAVEDDNNNRQGCLSFGDVFVPNEWKLRQFGFIVALAQTNAYLLFNYG